jgi:hypothetical protein
MRSRWPTSSFLTTWNAPVACHTDLGFRPAQVTGESGTCQITVDPGITITAPHTTGRDITRHKASNCQPG